MDLEFFPSSNACSRPTIILGPNASGKSNLFDALQLLSHMVTSRSLIEAFKEHRGDPLEAFDFGDIGLSGLLDKEEAQFSIEVDVELSKKAIGEAQQKVQKYRPYNGATSYSSKSTPRLITESLLRYRLCVAITPKTGVLQVKEEYLGALKSDRDKLRPDERRKPFLELVDNQLRLRMEGQARPTEYQIGLNYTIVSQPLYPPTTLTSWHFKRR